MRISRDRVKLVSSEEGDWEVLLLGGEVYWEGHSIPSGVWMELISHIGIPTATVDSTEEIHRINGMRNNDL